MWGEAGIGESLVYSTERMRCVSVEGGVESGVVVDCCFLSASAHKRLGERSRDKLFQRWKLPLEAAGTTSNHSLQSQTMNEPLENETFTSFRTLLLKYHMLSPYIAITSTLPQDRSFTGSSSPVEAVGNLVLLSHMT